MGVAPAPSCAQEHRGVLGNDHVATVAKGDHKGDSVSRHANDPVIAGRVRGHAIDPVIGGRLGWGVAKGG
jgi:hypothetical protein